jgi:hypothetical protein
MGRTAIAVVAALILAAAGRAEDPEQEKKGKRPALEVRTIPRYAFSPVHVLAIAELKGGDDREDYYCPEVEWEWGDGGKSIQEGDCEPWAPGTKIQRRYSNEHDFTYAGRYTIKVTLRRTGRAIASGRVTLTVRPGAGDRSPDPGL